MVQTQIKICGLRPGDDLSFVADPLVTHVGIIFVEASKRFVHPVVARDIAEKVHQAKKRVVGVFANATSPEAIMEVARQTDVDVVQLHGEETVEVCQALTDSGLRVWKSIQIPQTGAQSEAIFRRLDPYLSVVQGILLDAKPPAAANVTGGHGLPFDWCVLQELSERLEHTSWWVAGGITPENVHTLLDVCLPTGIDVSSGVEAGHQKSPARISQLIEAVKKF